MTILRHIRARYYLRKSRWLASKGKAEEAQRAFLASELLFQRLDGEAQ